MRPASYSSNRCWISCIQSSESGGHSSDGTVSEVAGGGQEFIEAHRTLPQLEHGL